MRVSVLMLVLVVIGLVAASSYFLGPAVVPEDGRESVGEHVSGSAPVSSLDEGGSTGRVEFAGVEESSSLAASHAHGAIDVIVDGSMEVRDQSPLRIVVRDEEATRRSVVRDVPLSGTECSLAGMPFGSYLVQLATNTGVVDVARAQHFAERTEVRLAIKVDAPPVVLNVGTGYRHEQLEVSLVPEAPFEWGIVDGMLTLEGLPAHHCYVLVKKRSDGHCAFKYIPIACRRTAEPKRVVLAPPGAIQLRVSNADPGDRLQVRPALCADEILASEVVSEGGHAVAEFEGLPQGEFKVTWSSSAGDRRHFGVVTAGGVTAAVRSLVVVVGSLQTNEYRLVLDVPRPVAGVVKMGGDPVVGASVVASMREWAETGKRDPARSVAIRRVECETGKGGQFELQCPSHWRVVTIDASYEKSCARHVVDLDRTGAIEVHLGDEVWVAGWTDADHVEVEGEHGGVYEAHPGLGREFAVGGLRAGSYEFRLVKGGKTVAVRKERLDPPGAFLRLRCPEKSYRFVLPAPLAAEFEIEAHGQRAVIPSGSVSCAMALPHRGRANLLAKCKLARTEATVVVRPSKEDDSEYRLPSFSATLLVNCPASLAKTRFKLWRQGGAGAVPLARSITVVAGAAAPVVPGRYLMSIDGATSAAGWSVPITLKQGDSVVHDWVDRPVVPVTVVITDQRRQPQVGVTVFIGDGSSSCSSVGVTNAQGSVVLQAAKAEGWRAYVDVQSLAPLSDKAAKAVSATDLAKGWPVLARGSDAGFVEIVLPFTR